jgi:potassium-dependent mechanosensitive channel
MGSEMGPLQGAATAAATVAAAVAMHVGLRRLRCRLPLVLTRRRLGHPATHPDPALDRLIGVAVLPLTASVWLGAIWIATDTSAALRAARAAGLGALHMAFTMPLFAIDDRPYALLDVLALPVALGVAWIAVGALTHLVQSRVLAAAGVARGAQETVGTLLRLLGGLLAGIVVLQAWGLDVRSLALVASVLGVGFGALAGRCRATRAGPARARRDPPRARRASISGRGPLLPLPGRRYPGRRCLSAAGSGTIDKSE